VAGDGKGAMKVFIENEAGSDQKNLFDEKTLTYQKTVLVSRSYPYPYGFILDTTSGDSDNVDCFVVTDQKLVRGQIVDCEPIGLMEQIEDGETDHNIVAVLKGEERVLNKAIQDQLRDFVSHIFDHLPKKSVTVGEFLGKEAALAYIQRCAD
jgi:inorganic pyrophosphatase